MSVPKLKSRTDEAMRSLRAFKKSESLDDLDAALGVLRGLRREIKATPEEVRKRELQEVCRKTIAACEPSARAYETYLNSKRKKAA